MAHVQGPKLSIAEQAAAQNKKGTAEAANKVKHAKEWAKVVEQLRDRGITHNPNAPIQSLRDVLKAHDAAQKEFGQKKFSSPKRKPKQGKAIGGPIENPMEKKQKPLYEEELGMYGGGSVRKKVYARGGSTRPTRG